MAIQPTGLWWLVNHRQNRTVTLGSLKKKRKKVDSGAKSSHTDQIWDIRSLACFLPPNKGLCCHLAANSLTHIGTSKLLPL